MILSKWRTLARVMLGWLAACGAAQADDIFSSGHVDGELRAYYFDRLYASKSTDNASAFSTALLINAQTGDFLSGFSLGASFAGASSFGTHARELTQIDTTLAGPNNSIATFAQAYLQYRNGIFLFRGGYQYLADDPWMSSSDSRVIPASYNALKLQITPMPGWDLFALRQYSWKSRTSAGMFADNLYYRPQYHGDSMYGNHSVLPLSAPAAPGSWEIGTTYTKGNLNGQLRYYDFLRFARSLYAAGSYVFETGGDFKPVLGAQYLAQSEGPGNRFTVTDSKLFGIAGNHVSGRAIGGDLGMLIPNGRLDLYYNKVAHRAGAVGGGALIGPYTIATDPLFTTSMIRGLVETGPGRAWKARYTYLLFGKQLQIALAYAKYTTRYYGDSHDLNFDVIYRPGSLVEGLTLRYRWELSSGGSGGLNPGNRSFIYSRVMLAYKF